MPNLVNRMVVRDLAASFRDAEGVLVVSMSGLTVAESDELRTSLAEKDVRLHLVRNSLARLAMRESGIEMPDEIFEGSLAIAVGSPEHAIHAAKVCTKSSLNKAGKLAVKAGVLDGEILGEADAAALADVPDRDTVNAQILGALSGPARGLVCAINALPAGVARVVQARVDQGAEEQG